MRILHLGNIANNSYNNVKCLSEKLSSGYQFTVISYDNPHGMASPEWEESQAEDVDEYYNDWKSGKSPTFDRPDWFIEKSLYRTSCNGEKIKRFPLRYCLEYYKLKASYSLKQAGISKNIREIVLPKSASGLMRVLLFAPSYSALYFLSFIARKLDQLKCSSMRELVHSNQWPLEKGVPQLVDKYARISQWLKGYDLIEAYSTDVIYAYLNRNAAPYIAYEHGTLRDLPFEDSLRGKLLSKAYQNARHVFITNPDVINSAKKLGLERYSFVPHIVDTNRYKPGSSDIRKKLNISKGLFVLAPARQNWPIKGNDVLVKGFAQFLDAGGFGTLVICDWGQHCDETHWLINKLGIESSVRFFNPAPKLHLLKYYQAADVVADQFILGTFGGIVPEAMSCEVPVLTKYEPKTHDWCFPEHPPLLVATTSEVIATRLLDLQAKPKNAIEIGRRARKWVEKYYSVRKVIDGHFAVYHDVENNIDSYG